jgi:hypothetical protein
MSFEPSSRVLVLGAAFGPELKLPQLFYRRIDDDSYSNVAKRYVEDHSRNGDERRLFVSSWSLGRNAWLYSILERHGDPIEPVAVSPHPDPNTLRTVRPVETVGLFGLNLSTFESDVWSAEDLKSLGFYWREVLGGAGDHQDVHVILGQHPDGRHGVVRYSLARASLSTRTLDVLSELHHTHF